MWRVGGVLIAAYAAGGCFAEVTAAYVPAMNVSVAQYGTPIQNHKEAAAVVAFHLGFSLEAFGVGVHYSTKFAGGTGVTSASGVPDHFGGAGWRIRGDVSIPKLAFPIGIKHYSATLRATYAYQKLQEINLGPDSDGASSMTTGSGSSHLIGATVAIPNNDLNITLGILKTSIHSDPGPTGGTMWPAFETDGTGIAISVLGRFIPTSTLTQYYVYHGPPAFWCSSGYYHEECTSYGMAGTRCESVCN